MSNASTNAQARREFLDDLKRLNPKRDAFLEALEKQVAALAALAQKRRTMIGEAVQAFVNDPANKATLDSFVDAELAARGDE